MLPKVQALVKKGSNSEKKDSFYDVDRLNTDAWTNGGGDLTTLLQKNFSVVYLCYSVQASILDSDL